MKALGAAGVHDHHMRQRFTLAYGKTPAVFELQVYAIKACAHENIKNGYRKRNVYILSDSQTAIKVLTTVGLIQSLSGTVTSP
jgi:hypothetical protein